MCQHHAYTRSVHGMKWEREILPENVRQLTLTNHVERNIIHKITFPNVIKAAVKVMSELSKPVICFSVTFSVDSTPDGCAVTMENDKHVFVFGATRSNNNLSLLECFSVPKAGEYSVSVHEILHVVAVQKHVCTEVNNITVLIRESMLLLTLRAHAQRGLQYLVCWSVCLSVCPREFSDYRLRGGQ